MNTFSRDGTLEYEQPVDRTFINPTQKHKEVYFSTFAPSRLSVKGNIC